MTEFPSRILCSIGIGSSTHRHERKKERYTSNPDVDPERSHLNYHLIQPRLKYYGEIQTRIEKAQRENPKMKLRKDSVKFIDTIITATPEFLEGLSEERRRFYFEHALEFLKREVGEENIFSAVVHMTTRISPPIPRSVEIRVPRSEAVWCT